MKYTLLLLISIFLGLCDALAQDIISAQAQAETARKNFAPALAELDALLAKDPKSEVGLTYRANLLSSAGQFDKSLSDASAALKINPKNINALLIAGGAKVSLKLYPDAIKYFSTAIEVKPDLAASWMMRAKTYVQTAQIENAIKDFDEVIKLEPKSIEGHLLRARMYIRKEEPQYALQDYIFVKENTPSGSPVSEVAIKEFGLAERLYERLKQNQQAAVREKMLADLNKEEATKAKTEMDDFSRELGLVKDQQEIITRVVKEASAEILALNNTPANDYFKQVEVRLAARPKLLAIAAAIDKAVDASAAWKSEFSVAARNEWVKLGIANSLGLERTDEYSITSNRVMGNVDQITAKTNELMTQVKTAHANNDKAAFEKFKTAVLESLKASIKVANQGYQQLAPFKKPSLTEFKKNIDIYVDRNTKDLEYFESLRMP